MLDILTRVDRDHARDGARRFGVDAGDARMRGIGAQEAAIELAGEIPVGGVAPLALQQPRIFAASGKLAAVAGSGVDCQATNFQPCGVRVQALRNRSLSVFAWPPISASILARPVMSAVSP